MTTPFLTVTPAAAQRILKITGGDATAALRLAVNGGGCSGFQYGFSFEENESEGDTHIVNDDVVMLVDPMSYQYLIGAEVDYKDDLEGSRFVINNPNAQTTCGCGSSFGL